MPAAIPPPLNTITGDVAGTRAGSSLAATLATVNSNVGSFTAANITVNAKGLVTAAANGSASVAVGDVTGLGTGVATALAVNVGSAGAFLTFNGALGTPSSGTVTNLTGTASININGTVGATTANTGAFTAISATDNISLVTGKAIKWGATSSLPQIGNNTSRLVVTLADGSDYTYLATRGAFFGSSSTTGIKMSADTYLQWIATNANPIASGTVDTNLNRVSAGVVGIGTGAGAGTGGSLSCLNVTAGGSVTIGGGTAIAKNLSATATLDFGSTAAGADTDLTVTVTGAALGDVVNLGIPNASMVANGYFIAWVSATNTVTVRYHNAELVTTQNPASGSFRVQVLQH